MSGGDFTGIPRCSGYDFDVVPEVLVDVGVTVAVVDIEHTGGERIGQGSFGILGGGTKELSCELCVDSGGGAFGRNVEICFAVGGALGGKITVPPVVGDSGPYPGKRPTITAPLRSAATFLRRARQVSLSLIHI